MPRDITVTLQDGTQHVYKNAPDDVTPDAVTARASKEFGQPITHLDGGRSAAASAQDPSLLDQVRGYAKGLRSGLDLPSQILQTGMELGARGSDAVGLTKGLYPMLHGAYKEGMNSYLGDDKYAKGGHDVGRFIGTAPLAAVNPVAGGGVIPAVANGMTQGGLATLLTSPDRDGDILPQLGVGTGLGGILGATGSYAGKLGGALLRKFSGDAVDPTTRAVGSKLLNAMGDQQPADISMALSNTGGKPLTLMDVAGENSQLQRLARKLVTMPGEQSGQMTEFLNNRAGGQRSRILGDIGELAPNTDTYGTQAALSQERSFNSDPLYQKAFANSGVGPVDYEGARNAVISATSQKAQIAKQIKAIEQNSSGALAARGAAGADTRAQYMDLQDQLKTAEANRLSAASKFENAQAGISAIEGNQPLTDERLADFMSDKDIRAGMQRGLSIQKRNALARGEEFDPNAYAISGYDEKGLPQVGAVPTWRTLHAGREGLDAIIDEFRDPVTNALPNTKLVNSYTELRKAYGDTLQRLNPDLKAADAAWSGPSQKKDAIRLGGELLKADPEQITSALGRMNPETAPFHGVGAGRALRDVANDTGDTRDITLRLNNDQTTRDQISAAFGSDPAKKFQDALDAERAMRGTQNFVLRGSQTANKVGDFGEVPSAFSPKEIATDLLKGAAGGPTGMAGAVGTGIVARGGSAQIAKMFPQMKPEVAKKLAEILMAQGSQGATALSDVTSPIALDFKRAALAKRLGGRYGAALGGPAALAGVSNLSPSGKQQ